MLEFGQHKLNKSHALQFFILSTRLSYACDRWLQVTHKMHQRQFLLLFGFDISLHTVFNLFLYLVLFLNLVVLYFITINQQACQFTKTVSFRILDDSIMEVFNLFVKRWRIHIIICWWTMATDSRLDFCKKKKKNTRTVTLPSVAIVL